MDKLAIIGTGLIGASLGLAIKQALPKVFHIVGTDMARGHANMARGMGAVDQAEGSIRRAVEDARIVIVATPVMAIRDIMEAMAPDLAEGCLVTDTGSTKASVMKWAEELLPRHVHFIGGHPMAGKEASGPKESGSDLFRDKTYCLIPGTRASSDAVQTLVSIVDAIGARHYFIDAEEHDSFVAAASHLPLLLSVALVRCTSKSPSWEDIAQVASTGYRDITRLASGDPTMHRDIFATNGEFIVSWIDAFIRELYEMRQQILQSADGDATVLEEVLDQALRSREEWLAGRVIPGYRHKNPHDHIPSSAETMGQFFVGDRLLREYKRLGEDISRKDKRERK